MNTPFSWRQIENNNSLTIRVVRIILLILIIVGLILIFTRNTWVPPLVNYILR